MDRETVTGALMRRYPTHGIDAMSQDELIILICGLSRESLTGHVSLLEAIGQSAKGGSLGKEDFAILSFLDDCCRIIFKLTGLEFEIEQQLRYTLPALAISLLQKPELAISNTGGNIINVLDLICEAALGWHADLGKQGENLYTRIEEAVHQLNAGSNPKIAELDFDTIVTELDTFFRKEKQRVRKLEERLRASEAGTLRARQATTVATKMLNDQMRGKSLPNAISEFLQGPWYQSVQIILINHGPDSDAWRQAVKMTETVIWSLQPLTGEGEQLEKEKQKLYGIIEHLPEEIRGLLVTLEHQADIADTFLAALEEEHVRVVGGFDIEYEDYELLPEAPGSTEPVPSVSGILLRKIRDLQEDDWFLYEPEADQVSRVKLALKLDDVKQMLFTNRNGMRTLEGSFDEVAYLLTRGILKRLTVEAGFASTLSTYLGGLMNEHNKRQAAEEAIAEADRAEQEQTAARQKALEEARALEIARQEAESQQLEADRKAELMKRATEAVENPDNADQLIELTDKVNQLKVGAWLSLPAADGVETECKLAVRIASADKLIFVTGSGMKVGDYSSQELVHLLIAGAGKIINEGIEFEDTLAKVVSGLREGREMSFDDLTGKGEELDHE